MNSIFKEINKNELEVINGGSYGAGVTTGNNGDWICGTPIFEEELQKVIEEIRNRGKH